MPNKVKVIVRPDGILVPYHPSLANIAGMVVQEGEFQDGKFVPVGAPSKPGTEQRSFVKPSAPRQEVASAADPVTPVVPVVPTAPEAQPLPATDAPAPVPPISDPLANIDPD